MTEQPDFFRSTETRPARGGDAPAAHAPLAERMRPRTLDEIEGHTRIVGTSAPLRRAVESGRLPSLLLWGPPGSGKTTIARVIAAASNAEFREVSAVEAGVKELRAVIEEARRALRSDRRTILFIDEIHRFNKAQQDAILPAVESGDVTLIGATTENPSFEVNAPLRSRTQVVRLQSLPTEALGRLLRRALADEERGLGGRGLQLGEAAEEAILKRSNGDARMALNLLEAAAGAAEGAKWASTPAPRTAAAEGAGRGTGDALRGATPSKVAAGATHPEVPATATIDISAAVVDEIARENSVVYDKAGGRHFDHASAFQKSLRGSDPDAALYWMGKMFAAGEDPRFVARRILVTAAEDVGLADPRALPLAIAAFQALEFLGMPEARIPLAEAAIYIATAPKSNSAIRSIDAAMGAITEGGESYEVPPILRMSGRERFDYQSPHEAPHHFHAEDYLPPELRGRAFYSPSEMGEEKELARRVRGPLGRHRTRPADPPLNSEDSKQKMPTSPREDDRDEST